MPISRASTLAGTVCVLSSRSQIGNGELVFTPDATREECDRIVAGINNVAKRIAKGG